jgi:hypothetical protein
MNAAQNDINPATPAATTPGTSVLKTKIPSAVVYGVGLLLFFLPFLDIKCNSMVLQKVSGVQLATGFRIESPGSDNSLVGSLEKLDRNSSSIDETEKKDANLLALASLVLGIAAFICVLATIKTGGMIAGLLAAVGLIATMIDVKSELSSELPALNTKAGKMRTDFDKFSNEILISVDFTPAFYIAILAFGTGAFLCYKWWRQQ